MQFRSSALPLSLAALPIAALLSGCSMNQLAPATSQSTVTLIGKVQGGQQPIVGSHVYMMQANTTGYGQPSISMLNPTFTGHSDALGGFVLTGSDGSFSITGDYTCTANTQVYLYALGGNPGAGSNSAAGELAALGSCPVSGSFGRTVPYIFVNEISTVATAYSFAGYAVDATTVSTSGSTLAQLDIANAFATATNLEGIDTGVAFTTTPAGNGTVPASTINTLANILASCINSNGPSSTSCNTLFANARSAGSTGNIAADTATAAINIAHNPAANVAALFALVPANPPFGPGLAAAPNDFILAVTYAGQGAGGAYSLALDGVGNVWVTNVNNRSISKLSNTGTPLSPASGYTAGNQFIPGGIAIDLQGNAWVADAGLNNLTEYSTGGNVLSPTGGFTGGGISSPQGISIDGSGNVWTANLGNNTVSKFNSAGTPQSGTGFSGGGLNSPTSIAIDSAQSAWVPNQSPAPGTLTKLGATGSPFSPSSGYLGGGLNNPLGVAIDGANSAWIANYGNSSISKFDQNGNALSGANGITGGGIARPYQLAVDGSGNIWTVNNSSSTVSELNNTGAVASPSTGFAPGYFNTPQAVDIDGAGNIWVANFNSGTAAVTELIGAAIPRVTPLSYALKIGQVAARP
jgi:hypothetical protein